MLALFSNANACLLFSKLCQHNLPTPSLRPIYSNSLFLYYCMQQLSCLNLRFTLSQEYTASKHAYSILNKTCALGKPIKPDLLLTGNCQDYTLRHEYNTQWCRTTINWSYIYYIKQLCYSAHNHQHYYNIARLKQECMHERLIICSWLNDEPLPMNGSPHIE